MMCNKKRLAVFSQLMLLTVFLAGCSTGNRKAEWITDALQSIKDGRYPRIVAVSYWNEIWENSNGSISDLTINSSPETLEAFQTGIADDVIVAQTVYSADSQKVLPPESGIYFSAYPDFGDSEDTVTAERIEDFEALAVKQIAWVYFSNNWIDGIEFPHEAVATIHEYSRLPFIRMMAISNYDRICPDSVYTLQRIIDGDFDEELSEWAQDAKVFGFPLMVEFGVEVNGEWFPWNGAWNGGDTTGGYGDPAQPDGPERFKDAYRHIIDLFRGEGATNITWVFHVNSGNFPDESWNSKTAYYPGDEYIDWIGISAYGALSKKEARQNWETFTQVMDTYYPELAAISASKPLAVLEFGVVE